MRSFGWIVENDEKRGHEAELKSKHEEIGQLTRRGNDGELDLKSEQGENEELSERDEESCVSEEVERGIGEESCGVEKRGEQSVDDEYG